MATRTVEYICPSYDKPFSVEVDRSRRADDRVPCPDCGASSRRVWHVPGLGLSNVAGTYLNQLRHRD